MELLVLFLIIIALWVASRRMNTESEPYAQPVVVTGDSIMRSRNEAPDYCDCADAAVPVPMDAEGSAKIPAPFAVRDARHLLTTLVLPRIKERNGTQLALLDIDQVTARGDKYGDTWAEMAFNAYDVKKNVGIKLFAKLVRVDKEWFVLHVGRWNVTDDTPVVRGVIDLKQEETYAAYVPPIAL